MYYLIGSKGKRVKEGSQPTGNIRPSVCTAICMGSSECSVKAETVRDDQHRQMFARKLEQKEREVRMS